MDGDSGSFAEHFGVENIPFGVASQGKDHQVQCCSRIADEVLFLGDLESMLQVTGLPKGTLAKSTLNEFAALGRTVHREVRKEIQRLHEGGLIPETSKVHIHKVEMYLPITVGDFTDFSCSSHHGKNAGQALMGASRDLPPGYLHLPLGYAGRSGSLKLSGTPVIRPRGLFFEHGLEGMQGRNTQVVHGPTQSMDFELEMGAVVGRPVPYGQYIGADEAREHIFGYVLLNDWSARDIQQLEMRPVGPLNSKHTATTVSPWIVTPDALEAFQQPVKASGRKLAPHLREENGSLFAASVKARILDQTGSKAETFCDTILTEMDWTFEALLAHQASSGCGLRSGDLIGIGTISGPGDGERGCLLEQFAGDNQRRRGYLEDGEEVQLIAYCGNGVGFGDCRARIVSATDSSKWSTA